MKHFAFAILIVLATSTFAQPTPGPPAANPAFPVLIVRANVDGIPTGFRGTAPTWAGPVKLNGITWSGAGVFTTPPATNSLGRLTLNISPNAKFLRATIGWYDPSCVGRGDVAIFARANGVVIWPSTTLPMPLNGTVKPIEIPVDGLKKIEIVVDSLGTEWCDDPIWVNAHFAN